MESMKYEEEIMKDEGIEEGVRDLRDRTKGLALRVVKLYSDLPKSTEAQVIARVAYHPG